MQVQETGLQCGGRAALSVIDGIEALFRSGLNLWRVLFTRQPVSYSGKAHSGLPYLMIVLFMAKNRAQS